MSNFIKAKIEMYFRYDPNHPSERQFGETLVIPKKAPKDILEGMRSDKDLQEFKKLLNIEDNRTRSATSRSFSELSRRNKKNLQKMRSDSVSKKHRVRLLPCESSASETKKYYFMI